MADKPKTNLGNPYAPLPKKEGESLFSHTFQNLRTNALNAGENLYDPRTATFVSLVTSDSFLRLFTSHGGSVDDAVAFAKVGHEKRLEIESLGVDIAQYDNFAKEIYAALDADDETAADNLIIQSVETPVVASKPDEPIIDAIAQPLYTQDQTNIFWNAYTNLNAQIKDNNDPKVYDYSRELLTYIQADDRYIAAHESYLVHNTELSNEEKETLRVKAQIAHENSVRSLDETGGFSTDLFGASQDFYTAIEQNFSPILPAAPVVVASIGPAPVSLAPAFDAATATRILGEELTQAPIVPIVTITMPSAPDILPEQIDVSAFNEEKLEEREAARLAAMPENSDIAPVVDTTTPPPAPDVVLAATEPTTPESTNYEIQDGDMLSKIVAEHYGLTKWADIQRVYETVARNNGIENPDLIYAGNKLVLFDDPTVDLFGKDKPAAGATVATKFNPAAEGTEVAANLTTRPVPRPEGLVASLG